MRTLDGIGRLSEATEAIESDFAQVRVSGADHNIILYARSALISSEGFFMGNNLLKKASTPMYTENGIYDVRFPAFT